MKNTMKKVVGAAMVAGVGYGAWMMYKQKNPMAMHDIKNGTKNALRKTADMLDDTASDM